MNVGGTKGEGVEKIIKERKPKVSRRERGGGRMGGNVG